MHILSPEITTALLESERENDHKKYFMINFHKSMLLTQWGLNPQPPDHQSNTHLTEPPRPATRSCYHSNIVHMGVRGGGVCREVGWESCNHLFLFVKLVLTLCDLYVHFNVSKWQILKVISFFYLFFWKKKGAQHCHSILWNKEIIHIFVKALTF